MSHNANTVFITPGNPPGGITVADIAAVLGRATADIGQLCADKMWSNGSLVDAGRIRMWAKYKPLRSSKLGILSASDRKSLNQGLTTTVASATGNPTTSSSFFYKLRNNSLPWTYLKPGGLNGGGTGQHEWYRYRDFEGYDNRATDPPGYPFSLKEVMLAYDNSLQIAFDEKRSGLDYELALSDLRMDNLDIDDWYFGVLLYYSSSSYIYAAKNKVGNGDLSVTFTNMNGWAGRRVQVVPFLSKTQISQTGASSTNATVISFLGFGPADVDIVANTSGVYAVFDSAEWNSANNAVSYAISIRNTNNVAKSGLSVYLELWEGSGDPAQGQSVDHKQTNNYSIAANAVDSTTFVGSFTGLTRTPGVQYFLAINTLNDNVIRRTVSPIEDYAERPLP